MQITPLTPELYKKWDQFCLQSDDVWFFHTTKYLDYLLHFKPELQSTNLSFMIVHGEEIIAICPLAVETISSPTPNQPTNNTKAQPTNNNQLQPIKELSLGQSFIPFPAFQNNLKIKTKRKVTKLIFNHIDQLAKQYQVSRASFRQYVLSNSFLQSKFPRNNQLMEYGYLDISLNTSVLDLTLGIEQIKKSFRRNHRRIVDQADQFQFQTFTKDNITPKVFKQYQEMHHRDAGRITRPQSTFDTMYQWILNKHAVLFEVSEANQPLGYFFIEIYKQAAYSGSCCSEPGSEEIGIQHLLNWQAINWLIQNHYHYFELGPQKYTPTFHHPASPKEMNISLFKRGFGPEIVPLFIGEKFYDKSYYQQLTNYRQQRFLETFNLENSLTKQNSPVSEFIPYGIHHLDESDLQSVTQTLQSNWLTTGPKVKEFENAICNYLGCQYAVAVSSGTAALELAVQSLDLPPNSEIITTPFTFLATANSILYNNHKIVFADIKPDTFNINPEEIKKKITNKTKAIIYVDYAGHPADIKEIKEIAQQHQIYLIEDAAPALGAEYQNQKVGNGHTADLTIFSLHPVKHLTTGEGGLITTNHPQLYQKLLMLRNHGIDKDCQQRYGPNSHWSFDMKYLGRNYRLTDFQCALGISQLKKLDSTNKKRQIIVNQYHQSFSNIPEITLPITKPFAKHAWHLYTILLSKDIDRNLFFQKMRDQNIGVNVHYIPCYHHTYYKENFNFQPSDFPVTEDIFQRIITLPLFPSLTEEQIRRVINATKKTIQEIKNNK